MLFDKLDGAWYDGAYWEYDLLKSPCSDFSHVENWVIADLADKADTV